MANWLERARLEIPQTVSRHTANTVDRNLLSVMAVSEPGKVVNLNHSIGSNGSTETDSFQENRASAEQEQSILAWLVHIGETNSEIIASVLENCRADSAALAYFLRRATEFQMVSVTPGWATCATCGYFHRTAHQHLGHCTAGEPEDPAGLWDTDMRTCQCYQSGTKE